LGPNGAGKSTLLRCLLGQRPVPPGRLQVAGHDPALEPLKVRQRVGYMPENDVYIPGLNALELVAFCGQLSGMRRADALARAHEALAYVELGEARYREVDGYSTGMRQRVRLAQALVHGPELILLDEPTTGLDPVGRDGMLQLIDDVSHRRGIAVLFSSHILKDIERTCDDLVVMNHGRVLFTGTRQAFQHQEARTLHLRVKEGTERVAAGLRAAACQVTDQAGTGYLVLELPEGATPDLVWKVAQQTGTQVRHLAPASLSLEQAFERVLTQDSPGEGAHGR
jgi:ABC-2 type transport system ATP-binding protein